MSKTIVIMKFNNKITEYISSNTTEILKYGAMIALAFTMSSCKEHITGTVQNRSKNMNDGTFWTEVKTDSNTIIVKTLNSLTAGVDSAYVDTIPVDGLFTVVLTKKD